ncbi:alpha/beta hydrolase [Tomitella biformata]|uniref:alpha/beta hydrolase n=1 Tax=Tomitella biformata TaxID=630403 RepID=UPI0004AD87E4|nr:alpha/beta hydrolase family protein [Tomitella biformata]
MILRNSRRATRAAVQCAAAALIVGVLPALAGAGVASAGPTSNPAQTDNFKVHSPSMDRDIPIQVLVPKNQDIESPVFYLLNGAGGGEDSATWSAQTDATDFFKDKQVFVVTPLEGAFSYYTDWNEPDPGLAKNLGNNGVNKWQTFLTEELPKAIDAKYNVNGKQSLAGISMAGSSVLDLAIQAPTLYSSIGAYSGCAMTSDPLGSKGVQLVTTVGGADPTNMWGPVGGPQWVEHDPYVNADKLPRVPMFISTGSGLPGEHDNLGNWRVKEDTAVLANQIIVGGGIEAITSACTHMLQLKTDSLGMTNIHYDFPVGGSHSWGYWQDDLSQSWPMLSAPLYATD